MKTQEDGIGNVGSFSIDENGDYKIKKGHSQTGNNGFIFKNSDNYYNKNDVTLPVYVPEYQEGYYTREDFEKLCGDRAEEIFEDVDWQCPETLLSEREDI